MPNPFTTPIGEAGAAVCKESFWEVEPSTTPVELMCSMLGLTLQAQLDEQPDDHVALLLALTGNDDIADTVLRVLFQSLSDDVTKAVDAAIEAWLPKPEDMARAESPPTRIEPDPLTLYRTRIMDAIGWTGDEPNTDSNASSHWITEFTVAGLDGVSETWRFDMTEGEWKQQDLDA